MKRMKFTAFAALLLCLVLLLSSCTFFDMRKLKLNKIFQDGFTDDTSALLHAEAVNGLAGSVNNRAGRLYYLRESSLSGTVHRVYDVETNRVVYTFTDADPVTVTAVRLHNVGASVAFSVVKTDATDPLNPAVTTELYAVSGTPLDSTKGDVEPTVAADLVQLDKKCFRVSENGETQMAFESNGLGSPLSALGITATAGGYYQAVTTTGVTIYDGSMKPTGCWEKPSYVAPADLNFFVLHGGNVLIQYETDAATDAKLYTYLDGSGVKKDVTTLLLKAKNGKVSKLMSDFLFASVERRDGQDETARIMRLTLNEKITTIAYAAKVQNRRVDASLTGLGVYLLSDTGRVRGTLNATLKGQKGERPEKLTDDRYRINLQNGQTMLVDTKGDVISEITGVTVATPAFLVGSGKIYNYQMNDMLDLKTAEMQVVKAYDAAIILKKIGTDEWHVMTANGQETYLAGTTNNKTLHSTASERYFVLKNNADPLHPTYEYYNEAGAQLLTLSFTLSAEGTWRNFLLMSGYDADAGKTVYYRFYAA